MADPIEANYVPDGADWTVTVTGRGRALTATAPGIIAARDRADQLVEELTPDEAHRTVVHLLNGDAVEFTSAYLTARMSRATPAPEPEPEQPEREAEKATPKVVAARRPSPAPR
ncbi:MAG: hypothetical protein ACJ72N_28060 [Labedaea sp.]